MASFRGWVWGLGLALAAMGLAAGSPRSEGSPGVNGLAAGDLAPGERVLFDDDFSGYELREFPHWWEWVGGVFEVGQQGDDRVIVCLETGAMRPKLRPGPLPAGYRVEIDFYGNDWGDIDQYFLLSWTDEPGREIGRLVLNLRGGTQLRLLDRLAAHRELPAPRMGSGLHHLRVRVADARIEVLLDDLQIASTPNPAGFRPEGFRIGGRINDEEVPCVFSRFRCVEEAGF